MTEVMELTPVTDRVKFDRGDVLCRVEIDCRVANHPLPCGYLAQYGKQIARVRKADLPGLLAQVEPAPQEIDAAKRRYEVGLTKFINEGLEGIIEPSAKQKRREQLEAEYAGSVEAIFFRDNDRSILPFVSVKVLDDALPVPADETQLDQQTMMAKVIAAEVAKALVPVIASLQQQKKS